MARPAVSRRLTRWNSNRSEMWKGLHELTRSVHVPNELMRAKSPTERFLAANDLLEKNHT